jgi:MFS family permease
MVALGSTYARQDERLPSRSLDRDSDASSATQQARKSLLALNFFSADQTGIGPFFSVFLQQHGWRSGLIGTVLTLGGVTGLLMAAPAGAVVDGTRRKRTFVILSGVFTIASSLVIWFSQRFWVVAASQVAGAIAAAFIGPAMYGITLGVTRLKGFNRQNGRNQAFNHAGNLAAAGLSGYLGWRFGLGATFLLGIGLGVVTIACVLAIPRRAVDDRAARGLSKPAEPGGGDEVQGLSILLRSRPLMVLVACLTFFNIGNAGMLPLYGLAVVGAHRADPAMFAALTVVVAQGVMVVMALAASRLVSARGYWLVILLAFMALPIRGVLAASCITAWGVWPVQALDGVGAGLSGVAVSGLMTKLLDGTGRVNAGQGAVGVIPGVGGCLSPALGGWLAQAFGYPAAFLGLGALSLVSLALWVGFAPLLREACEAAEEDEATDAAC